MAIIKNVAIVGASGVVGLPVLNAFINSGKFTVTVLSRIGSKATFPASVKVISVDYTSVESLTAALQGQDAIISAVGYGGLLRQSVLFDAAVAAGVKRFIPSEFGCDTSHPRVASVSSFADKVATRKYIEDKVKAGADITYTYVISGPFLDWGIDFGFLLEWQSGKPRIFDGGDVVISTTSLDSVGRAVVSILDHYEETKNRQILFHDMTITQNRMLELAKKAAPWKKWDPVPTKTTDVLAVSKAALEKGDNSKFYDFILVAIYGEDYGAKFAESDLDNKLLGLTGKTDADVEAIFKKVLK